MNVRLAREAAKNLLPPPVSIIDGTGTGHAVRTCCLTSSGGVSRLEVSLVVDEATAARFARTCRWASMWRRRVAPGILAVAGLILLIAVVDVVVDRPHLLSVALVLTLALTAFSLAGKLSLRLVRSRHHPKLDRDGGVVIRDIDRGAVELWADLNPRGAIEILG
ncbi:hypothetical protein AMK25_08940 [Micromonospora sp. TSRI0369]|nr:hypothetical protein AMK25_08940 [Micromonospora sp. TSRI0369]